MRTLSLLSYLVFAVFASAQTPSNPSVSYLLVEGMSHPMTIDTAQPRFSWRLVSDARGAKQSAYQLRIEELAPNGTPLPDRTIETDRIESDASQWQVIPGFSTHAKRSYQWQVRVWDEKQRDTGWSEPAHFETGLRGGDWSWPGKWISDGRSIALSEAPSARYFRHQFETSAAPAKARLYLAAFGLVEPWLNGRKLTEDLFLPGWPDYRRRVFYVAYDVTEHIRSGANALGLILGDGWFSGQISIDGQAGTQPLVSAVLELTDAEGKVTRVVTDENWRWAEGPIVEQGIYHGETFDARRDDPSWSTPDAAPDHWNWRPVQVQGKRGTTFAARLAPPVRRMEEIVPVSKKRIRPGVFIYDLGQNMVGWVRLKVRASAGQEIQLKFAEMLEAPDRLHTANLRSANATARYIAAGRDLETWEPRFTFFGFRYVEVTGVDEPLDDAITGIVLHNDLPRIGHFECSHPLLNQLFSNTLWGQKGNFLEAPTDCPQRDERLGWTGDAQVFAHTASYNLASGNFYRQWLGAVRDSFRDEPNGRAGFGDIAPDIGLGHGSPGWGDAGVIVPYVAWLHTGDRRLLSENFGTIQAWVERLSRDWPDGIRNTHDGFGDWLAPGFSPGKAATPRPLIATAYYARVADLAARIAAEFGDNALAKRYRDLFAHVQRAFQREFISGDGRVASDQQTAYLLALGFDLVPPELREKTSAHLVRAFAEKNDHLATGFLGTPLIAPVLSATNHTDLAYRVLLQETYPGWLFSVKNGATTIWERWDSWTPERGFHPEGMNSFNHYAYGSIVGWLYDTVAGLQLDPRAPGWKHFRIAPSPGGGLTHAKASVETPYGVASSAWRIDGDVFHLDVTIPANTTAEIALPAADEKTIAENDRPLSALTEASDITAKDGRVRFTLPAGTYRFRVAP